MYFFGRDLAWVFFLGVKVGHLGGTHRKSCVTPSKQAVRVWLLISCSGPTVTTLCVCSLVDTEINLSLVKNADFNSYTRHEFESLHPFKMSLLGLQDCS